MAALLGAVLGGVIAALATWFTARFTAKSTRDREERARLFTERRAAYRQVLLHFSTTQHFLLVDNAGPVMAMEEIPQIMADLECVGSREVIKAHVAGIQVLAMIYEYRRQQAEGHIDDGDEQARSALAQFERNAQDASSALREAIRADLGAEPVGDIVDRPT